MDLATRQADAVLALKILEDTANDLTARPKLIGQFLVGDMQGISTGTLEQSPEQAGQAHVQVVENRVLDQAHQSR